MSHNLKQAAIAVLEGIDEVDHILALLAPGKADGLYLAKAELKRALFEMRINELAEHGEVVVVESGRDCDCVEYSGRCHTIQATIDAYEALEDSIHEWADGPFHLDIMRPSEAESIRYSSRDLVLEAYEDGHPHSIVSQFG